MFHVRKIISIIGAIGLASVANCAYADSQVEHQMSLENDQLLIQLDVTPQQLEYFGGKALWQAACQQIGNSLVVSKGPWGLGPFESFECESPDANSKISKSASAQWTLRVEPALEKTTMHLLLHGRDAAVATATIPAGRSTLLLLQDEGLDLLIAATLMDQMPFSTRLKVPLYDATKNEIISMPRDELSVLEPPDSLAVFTLSYSPTKLVFQPKYIGTGKLTSPKGKTPYVWKLDTTPAQGMQLFVQGRGLRGANLAILSRAINDTCEKLLLPSSNLSERLGLDALGNLVSDSMASGYIGVRYGHSFFQGPVIEKMSVLSVLVAFRGTPFDGLRLYYDFWPKIQEKEHEGALLFRGERVVAGWSLGMKFKGLIIDRIDVVPKVGRWSVETDFAVADSSGSIVHVPFKVVNALSIGIESGVEASVLGALLRTWVSHDFGYNPLDRSQNVSVTNSRAGLDVLVPGPLLREGNASLRLSLLLFSFYENVTLSRDESSEPSDSRISVNEVSYNVAYLGGGIALSW